MIIAIEYTSFPDKSSSFDIYYVEFLSFIDFIRG